MKAFLIGIALVAAPAAGLAQTANTNCYTNGANTNCNTHYWPSYNGEGAVSGFAQGFSRGLDRGGSFGGRIALWRAERRQRHFYSEIGKLVADGRCQDARAQALGAGDFDLAQRVDAVCAAPAPQPKP